MAPTTGKRQRETNNISQKDQRKRVKVSKAQNTKLSTVQELSKSSRKAARPVRKAVPVNSLAWQAISLPDRFEDAEGFYGLEEIEGVDVVRDEATGILEFKVKSDKELQKTEQDTGNDDDQDGSADEWSGFGDEEEIHEKENEELHPKSILKQSANPTTPDVKVDTKKNKKKDSKKEKQLKKASKISTGAPEPTNPFDILEKGDEDEEDADVSAWRPLNLSAATLSSLSKMKFPNPTPIQSQAIPKILAGHDVIGKASTGSGKTLAFGIPILEYYLELHRDDDDSEKANSENSTRPPLALILSPTRELAHQLTSHLTNLCKNAVANFPRIATLTGGLSLQKQQRQLRHADVVIGTPGRLWEIISEGKGLSKWLQQIKFLVVDEADRLLSEGHFQEVEQILNALDRHDDDLGATPEGLNDDNDDEGQSPSSIKVERQTLVFSATFAKSLQQKLSGKAISRGGDLLTQKESMQYLLKKLNFQSIPKFIDTNPISQLATGLRETILSCPAMEKDLHLYAVLLLYPKARTLIFTNSISAVRRLNPFLQNLNIQSLALHSEMAQKARLRSVERFSDPQRAENVLIATDVAARGLDIKGIELIIHYHLPRTADMYVHRSGRTARAENTGTSIILCAPEEVLGMRRLVAKVHAASKTDTKAAGMNTVDLNPRLISRIRPRATLSKKIADSQMAKEKRNTEGDWLRTAAEELGVEYDSDEFQAMEAGGKKKGRGNGRRKKEIEARGVSKGELAGWRAELRELLKERVNMGVSERYLTSGGVDVDALLERQGLGEEGGFLGKVEGLDFA
ncbi:MAG: ATP-dependent RNA helicase [Cirrosporium novae-zelandiae]|nr:MAG: ATP-dependent RNA helicase [Cirrosporium novae-zelandiae]